MARRKDRGPSSRTARQSGKAQGRKAKPGPGLSRRISCKSSLEPRAAGKSALCTRSDRDSTCSSPLPSLQARLRREPTQGSKPLSEPEQKNSEERLTGSVSGNQLFGPTSSALTASVVPLTPLRRRKDSAQMLRTARSSQTRLARSIQKHKMLRGQRALGGSRLRGSEALSGS